MSATIGTLVDRLHQIATLVSADPAADAPEQTRAQEAGWDGLARHLARALSTLPFEEANLGNQIRNVAVTALDRISSTTAKIGPHGEPIGHLADAALVVGAIADLLTSRRAPFRVATQPWPAGWQTNPRRAPEPAVEPVFVGMRSDDASAYGLQSNLLAATHILAQWGVRQLGDRSHPLVEPLTQLVRLAEPHLWMDPTHRDSALESLTAVEYQRRTVSGSM